MIEIAMSILPVVWINSVIIAGLEPREKSFEGLIEHLKKLERSLQKEPISKKEKNRDDPDTESIPKKENMT